MDILIFSILTNFVYYCAGTLIFNSTNKDLHEEFYSFLVGAILISFVALTINFFLPLNLLVNSIIYLSIILFFLFKKKIFSNKIPVKFLIISSLITSLLILFSNTNRPDAGLYHLPYVSLLNENKIIFGANFIHFRFAHVSILQYLSGINSNYLFGDNGISIPLASLVSFFYIYFFYDIWKVIKKIDNPNIHNFFSLFIVIYMTFKITRYSSFGNDAVAHLLFFYLISYVLKNKIENINIKKIILVSVFAFLNKTMLGLIFIVPAIIFFIKNKFNVKRIFLVSISFPAFFLYLWLVKNIIISGCAIFPIESTCFQKLPWTQSLNTIKLEKNSGEAWAKAWPDREEKNISMEDYNKNLNWIKSWKKKHLIYISKIIIPYFILLISLIIYIKFKFKKKEILLDKDLKIRIFIIFFTCIIGNIIFFFYFPLYRYGYSYLITLICLTFIILIKDKILTSNINIFKFIFVLCIIIFSSKQFIKIYNNKQNTIWPNIYTYENTKKKYKKINIKENFSYYKNITGDQLCMYIKKFTPCTSYEINNNVYHLKKMTYSILISK